MLPNPLRTYTVSRRVASSTDMALPINLDSLFTGQPVEWERVEFKAGWNPLDVLQSISAFANDFHNLGGGYIILGVGEKGGRPLLPPKGLQPEQIDAIQHQLLELGNGSIRPAYHPLCVPHRIGGLTVLVIWVPGGQTRPYKARLSLAKGSNEWGYFIRRNSNTIRAKGADETELLGLAARVPFDDRVNQLASLDDLSRELIVEFLTEIRSDLAAGARTMPMRELASQMRISGGASEAPLPLNVGLLFFNPAPDRLFPCTQIDVVYFPDESGGDRFIEKTFRGPLHFMLREALAYIQRNYISETVIKRGDRAEASRVSNFPYAAVEEAVVNAVYHRSYEEREPIEVRVSPSEVAILSFPGPDRSISLEALRAGRAISRRYRNRRVGEFLKELRLTEGRATGIPKIIRAMRDNGSPSPLFETDDDRASLLVHLPVRLGARRSLTPQVTPQVTAQVEAVVLALCAEPRSAQEIRSELRLKDRKYFSSAYLQPLMGAGFLEPTIPEKPQSRLQRYRTTAAGMIRLSRAKGGASGGHPGVEQTTAVPPKSPPKSKAVNKGSKLRGKAK
jgi:ATP-dependent DNA helicase RecG